MQPRIHAITLAVDDLERALAFYRHGLAWSRPACSAPSSSATRPTRLEPSRCFTCTVGSSWPCGRAASWPRMPRSPSVRPRLASSASTHAVASKAEVDALIARAEAAGATVTQSPRDRPWGIYAGYFRDPDEHLWEIMWNPELEDI
ncbi:MAG TPA: VOC family protein [Ktedonobacterales bacterium]|nr:VOC family protein [Ktedonobacterales bacterium]